MFNVTVISISNIFQILLTTTTYLSALTVSHLVLNTTMTEPRRTSSLPNVVFSQFKELPPPELPLRDYPPKVPLRCVPPPLPERDYEAKEPRLPPRACAPLPPSVPPRCPIAGERRSVDSSSNSLLPTSESLFNNGGSWQQRFVGRLSELNSEGNLPQLPPVPPCCPPVWSRLPADLPTTVAPAPPHLYLTMRK